MAANSVNNDTAKEISKETDRFYGQLETKYSFSITRNDISQKLAVKDLFRELKAIKKETVKAQSETSLKEKNEIQKGWLTSYGVQWSKLLEKNTYAQTISYCQTFASMDY